VAIHRQVLKLSRKKADVAYQQLLNHSSAKELLVANLRRFSIKMGAKAAVMGGMTLGATAGTFVAPGAGSVAGAIFGAGAGLAANLILTYVTDETGLNAPVNLQTTALSPTLIRRQAENTTVNWTRYLKDTVMESVPNTPEKAAQALTGVFNIALDKVVPGTGALTDLPELAYGTCKAAQGITAAKAQKLEDRITRLIASLELNLEQVTGQFETLGIQSVSAPTFGNIFRRITPADLRKKTGHAIDRLRMTSQLGRRMSRSN